MLIGRVQQIFRYPVKSMAGETVQDSLLDEYGIIGDRCWSMIQSQSGDVASGKHFPKLMNLEAYYMEDHPSVRVYGEAVPPIAIRLPNGDTVRSDASPNDNATPNEKISEYIGSALRLHPLEPPEHREHYRYKEPLDEKAILKLLGIGEHETPPDLSAYEESLFQRVAEYYSPPGTYYDMSPVHLLTTSTLAHMKHVSGENFSVQRFRPNLLIETTAGIEGLAEFEWIGKSLQIGETLLQVDSKTIRCSMPARGQTPHDLEQNPKIVKSISETSDRFLGSYACVTGTGRIMVGDEVVLID